MQKLAHIASLFGIFLLAVFSVSCSSNQSNSNYIRERVEDLKKQTAPSAAYVKETSEIASKGQSVSAQWEFDTAQTRGEYIDWVTHRLQSNYVLESSTESRLVFGKQLEGDYESVKIEMISTNGSLRVKVAYVISAD